MGKIVGIMSLKGGVGKTSIVSSLGSSIAEFGKDVLLIDTNFAAPNLGIHFNIIDPEVTLHHVLSRKANVSDAIYSVGNLDVLPASIYYNAAFSPLRLREKIKFLKKKYDIILLDTPPTLDDHSLAAFLAADEIFFVTTPDHSTLSNTLKYIKEANQRGTPINGLIMNKVHDKDYELSLDDLEETTNFPVMAVLPYDTNVQEAQASFIPSVKHKPHSRGSKEFKKLAATLVGEKFTPFDWRGFFHLTPQKQDVNREMFYERVFE